jgi:hypothetical protein
MVYANSLSELTQSRLEQVKWWIEREEGEL